MDKNVSTANKENVKLSKVIPKLLPQGEVLGWNLMMVPDPVTKRNKYKFVVCIQTNSNAVLEAHAVETTCDGPCGNKMPSNHMISMGKCDHTLCRACYGLVKNPDGSYGCSNFYCWADARESFRHEKNNYREILKKQQARASQLRTAGENVKLCTDANLPETPCRTPTDSPVDTVKPISVKTTSSRISAHRKSSSGSSRSSASSASSTIPTSDQSSDDSSSKSSRKTRRKKKH